MVVNLYKFIHPLYTQFHALSMMQHLHKDHMLPHASGLLDQLMPIVYLYMGPQKDIGDTFEWGKKDM